MLLTQLIEAKVSSFSGEEIPLDQILSQIELHASDALEAYREGKILYRGWKRHVAPGVYDASTGERKSENTQNTYTMLFSDNPFNRGWPRRDKSFICSTSKEYAEKYGVVHLMLPYNGVEIGICGDQDIWDLRFAPTGETLRNFAQSVVSAATALDLPMEKYSDFSRLVSRLSDILEEESEENIKKREEIFHGIFGIDADDTESLQYFVSELDSFFTFNQNDFFTSSDSALGIPEHYESHELWFSGKCFILPLTKGYLLDGPEEEEED